MSVIFCIINEKCGLVDFCTTVAYVYKLQAVAEERKKKMHEFDI